MTNAEYLQNRDQQRYNKVQVEFCLRMGWDFMEYVKSGRAKRFAHLHQVFSGVEDAE